MSRPGRLTGKAADGTGRDAADTTQLRQGCWGDAVLKILHRYVMGEVLRAFSLALLTVTSVIVLFMVMIEAGKMGLSPTEILNLLPYVVPGSLPYTIPVSLLFAVTVVYGRLASDNEIVAMKTAGLSAMSALRPALLLGVSLSTALLYLTHDAIPRA